jgi:hypothetical protein
VITLPYELHEAVADQIADAVGVGHDARDEDAGLRRVEIGDGQPRDVLSTSRRMSVMDRCAARPSTCDRAKPVAAWTRVAAAAAAASGQRRSPR